MREREWEAAHTVWLWPDLSPSMDFRSHLSPTTKRDRAIVLDAGRGRAARARRRARRLARPDATDGEPQGDDAHRRSHHRQQTAPATFSDASRRRRIWRASPARSLFSDFLDPIAKTREHIEALAADGAAGHLVQILDPAEETLPYEGRTEFLSPAGGERWVADRAQSLRSRYRERFEAHRAELAAIAKRLGWSFLVHHTDRPASEPLLTLIMRHAGRRRRPPLAGPGCAAAPPDTEARP